MVYAVIHLSLNNIFPPQYFFYLLVSVFFFLFFCTHPPNAQVSPEIPLNECFKDEGSSDSQEGVKGKRVGSPHDVNVMSAA